MATEYMTTVTRPRPPAPANKAARNRAIVAAYIDGLWKVVDRHHSTYPPRALDASHQAAALQHLLDAFDAEALADEVALEWADAIVVELTIASTIPAVHQRRDWWYKLGRTAEAIAYVADCSTTPPAARARAAS